jgi:FAD binding domain
MARRTDFREETIMRRPFSLDPTVSHRDLEIGIARLRSSSRGEVMTANDDGYDAARAVWNAMIDRRPAVILRARGVDDVIAAVGFAGSHGLAISIRGGGHNVAGHAVGDDSVMIDLSAMRAVQVDPVRRRAWVEGGATWRDVDRETQAFGLATPGGLISDTGVAGLTLSGGIGWLRSLHGLTIDNLVAAKVVTADARLLTASSKENVDLLWALKGGRRKFWCRHKFRVCASPIGPEMMFCAPVYPIELAGRVIRVWRDFLADKSGVVGSLAEFSTVAEGPDFREEAWGKRVVTLAALYAGEAREGEMLMQPLRTIGGMLADFSGRMKYCDVQQLFDALMPTGQYRSYWKSHFLAGLSDAVIDEIVDGNRHPRHPTLCRQSGILVVLRRPYQPMRPPLVTGLCPTCSPSIQCGDHPTMMGSILAGPANFGSACVCIPITADCTSTSLVWAKKVRIWCNGPSAKTTRGSRPSSGNTTRKTSSVSTKTSGR